MPKKTKKVSKDISKKVQRRERKFQTELIKKSAIERKSTEITQKDQKLKINVPKENKRITRSSAKENTIEEKEYKEFKERKKRNEKKEDVKQEKKEVSRSNRKKKSEKKSEKKFNLDKEKTEVLNEVTLKTTEKQNSVDGSGNKSPVELFQEIDLANDDKKKKNDKEVIIEKSENIAESAEEISPSRPRKTMKELSFNYGTFVTENLNKLENNYYLGNLLGEGSFGQVKLVKHKLTEEERAMKIINKALIKNTSKLLQEINIMKQLDHPNILKIYEYYQDSKSLMLIMERCSGGELFDKILEKNSFSEKEAAFIIHQVLSAVHYAHQHNIVHRDLKPENILLDSDNDGMLSIKVIDWGLATFIQPNEKLTEKGGSAYYIAPEVLIQDYNNKCDIWSCGVILYILLSGCPPFGGRTDSEILENVRRAKLNMSGKSWEKISIEAKDLIKLMLNKSVEQRISTEKALLHPWFKILESNIADHKQINSENLEKLESFHCDQKFQQAVLTYIASQLIGKEEKEKLMQSFIELDKNGDGKLSIQEIIEGYKETMGEEKAKSEAERIMQEVDLDHSGFIDYTEFLTATMNRKTLLSEKKLKNAFFLFDKDKNGLITVEEIKQVLKDELFEVEEKVWDEMVEQVDENGDGSISFEEFSHMIMKFANL